MHAVAGIGLEFAKQLAADGWSVTVVARNGAKLNELIATLPGGAAQHHALVADLSNEAGIETAATELRAQRYELLVNNAGVGIYGKFQDANLDKIHAMMRLNMDALINLSHAWLKGAQKGDSLINVSDELSVLIDGDGAVKYIGSPKVTTTGGVAENVKKIG